MNKKADAYEFLMAIPRIIFMIVAFFSVIFLVRTYVIDNLDTKYLQAEIFADTVIYSLDGISYNDPDLGKPIMSLIDVSRLNNDNIEKLFKYNEKDLIAANITLFDSNNKQIASAIYNGKKYSTWLRIASLQLTGPGAINGFHRAMYVNYENQNNEVKSGMLLFDILLPGN